VLRPGTILCDGRSGDVIADRKGLDR